MHNSLGIQRNSLVLTQGISHFASFSLIHMKVLQILNFMPISFCSFSFNYHKSHKRHSCILHWLIYPTNILKALCVINCLNQSKGCGSISRFIALVCFSCTKCKGKTTTPIWKCNIQNISVENIETKCLGDWVFIVIIYFSR